MESSLAGGAGAFSDSLLIFQGRNTIHLDPHISEIFCESWSLNEGPIATLVQKGNSNAQSEIQVAFSTLDTN